MRLFIVKDLFELTFYVQAESPKEAMEKIAKRAQKEHALDGWSHYKRWRVSKAKFVDGVGEPDGDPYLEEQDLKDFVT